MSKPKPPIVQFGKEKPFEQFGVQFPAHWAKTTEMGRRMACARGGRGSVSVYEHRRWIIEHLWPSEVYDKSWTYEDGTVGMNPWSARRLKGCCERHYNIWMGPGGSGKTTDAAAIAVERYTEDPSHTAVIVCSTTKEMLRRRIWNEICRLWHALPDDILGLGQKTYKGELLDTACIIRWQPNDMKNGIFGVAVADGPVDEAINNLIGIHTTQVVLMLDEMQGVREAIMGALPNMVKNPISDFLGMGNPTSLMSMLCKYLEPIGGWNSVVRGETEQWKIDPGPYMGEGLGQFFDGRKSPAVLDPEWGKRNPWMISKEQVDRHIEQKGDSPEVWTMTIGWPPPLGTDNTVLDGAIVERFRCKHPAVWTNGYEDGAALDPAFEEGGDDKILQFMRVGFVTDEEGQRWVIEFGEWLDVPIDSNATDDPVEYQIMRFVREKCQSKGIPPQRVGTDSTGIGRGLLSIFRQEWGPVIGVEFGGKPSDMLVEDTTDSKKLKTAKEEFDRKSSELNIMVRRFAASNGLRGLPERAEKQFISRLTSYTGKYEVESKKKYKKRTGKSPDNADACCIGVEVARQMGAVPAQTVAVGKWTEERRKKLVEADRRFDERNYAEQEDWNAFAQGL